MDLWRLDFMAENESTQVTYNTEKDFYKGLGGKLRLKAEGLFKKAKEKGISIEEITITTLKENSEVFPGIGGVELPAFFVKVRGKDLNTNRIIVDGKQIDYFNRYQKYLANIIQEKGKPEEPLTKWERFEIGKSLIEDKEFGVEKTITGACDRIIRKLMGENDWLYPEEARLLDEEFNEVQRAIEKREEEAQRSKDANADTNKGGEEESEMKNKRQPVPRRKATDKQINYLKARVRGSGMNPDDEGVIKDILKNCGFPEVPVDELSTVEMSRVIDSLN
jgi:hypothetical protein